jgi:hypothetical protein
MATETKKTSVEAFPLYWPEGWPRTKRRIPSKFSTGFGAARNFTFRQIEMMGGRNPIVSSNLPLRNDGLPRANMPNPQDPGVAVYFKQRQSNGEFREMVFACDQYVLAYDNIYSIGKTIEALRKIKLWGASDMMERAFRGFTALPQKASTPWRNVLGFDDVQPATAELIERKFRELALKHHTDTGDGDVEALQRVVTARNDALKEIGGAA